MFRWMLKIPKWGFFIFLIFGGSSIFFLWYLYLAPWHRQVASIERKQEAEKVAKKAASLEGRTDRLFIADGGIYDAESGERIFTNWLNGDAPSRLFYDAKSNKLIGKLERGFVRYAMDGTREAELGLDYSPAFSADLKNALYCKNGDIWAAEIDWNAFSFINERQITHYGEFGGLSLNSNLWLSSPRVIFIQHKLKVLKVDFDSGSVKPANIPGKDIDQRRSPDMGLLLGEERNQLFAFVVESGKLTTWPIGREAFNGCQWLGEKKSAVLIGGQKIGIFDRDANTFLPVVLLPFACQRIGESSPNGRYVFCASRTTQVLVDMQDKTAKTIDGGNGLGWIDDSIYIFAREVPDTDRRGVWLQIPGGEPRRVTDEPYLVSRNGAQGAIFRLPITASGAPGKIIFVTKKAVYRMNPDGSGLAEIFTLPRAPTHMLSVEAWPLR